MLLFEEAPAQPLSDIDMAASRKLGAAIARLHAAADALEGNYELPVADAASVLKEMLPYARQVLPAEDCDYMEALAGRIRERLEAFGRERPDFGLCHADLVISNVRLNAEDSISFFDFGNARYTWRSCELAVVRCSLQNRLKVDSAQHWEALLEGYTEIRRLPADLPAALPVMLILRQLGWIAGNAATLPLRLGTEPFDDEIFSKTVAAIRALAAGHDI
jgi:Ser/Thr protein kinase RdoA (MazF antagonist)